MKKDVYPPLKLLNEVNSCLPEAWQQMAMFHRDNGKNGLSRWADWCYAPISCAMAVVEPYKNYNTLNLKEALQISKQAQIIHVLAPWRLSKEVYIIDADLKELLFENPTDIEIPCEILLQLPYFSFYVEVPDLRFDEDIQHGFFVALENDVNTGAKELRFLFVKEDGTCFGYPIHIDNSTIFDSIKKTQEQSIKNLQERNGPETIQQLIQNQEGQRKIALFMGQCLQIVLYILAQNADIIPDPEQTTITKRGKTIKDKYSEIRKWDVGYRIGNELRKQKTIPTDYQGGTHNSPRPHIRRGHWHHFWTGPRNDISQRKLILKWLSPMAIAVGDDEDTPVVFHEVKEEN